jgi:hypothetical protein
MSMKDYVTNDYSVEVNLVGTALDPERITEILQLQPAKSACRGGARPSGNGTYEEGYWVYEASSQDDLTECRDHQLSCLLESIEPHVPALRAAGVERINFHFTLSSFIGLMNIRFHSETMARLGAIDADLYVACYDCFDPKHPYWRLEIGDQSAQADQLDAQSGRTDGELG